MRSGWLVVGSILACCGDDGASAIDAAVDADVTDATPDAAVPACGTAALASTTFDERPPYLLAYINGGTYELANGKLRIDPTAPNRYQQWTSRYGWDLHGTSLTLELTAVPRQDVVPGAYVTYRLVSMVDPMDHVEVDLRGGQLSFRSRVGAAEQVQTLPWANQMKWRIREDAGMLILDVGDGATWTPGLTAPTRPFVGHLGLDLRVGGEAFTQAPGPVEIDSLLGAPASPGYCAAATLRDDFSASAIQPTWHPQPLDASFCVLALTAGEAVVTLPTTGFVCGFWSTLAYDLRGSSAHVHVVEPSATAGVRTRFEAESTCGESVFQYDPATGMVSCIYGSGSPLASFAYDSTSSWWRFRGTSSEVLFETSADGTAWTQRAAATTVCEPSVVTIEFGLRDNVATAPGTARFDSFNTPP